MRPRLAPAMPTGGPETWRAIVSDHTTWHLSDLRAVWRETRRAALRAWSFLGDDFVDYKL